LPSLPSNKKAVPCNWLSGSCENWKRYTCCCHGRCVWWWLAGTRNESMQRPGDSLMGPPAGSGNPQQHDWVWGFWQLAMGGGRYPAWDPVDGRQEWAGPAPVQVWLTFAPMPPPCRW
jgi:hypothetical protein